MKLADQTMVDVKYSVLYLKACVVLQEAVDRMLTALDANRERGRVELSKAGKWSVETIDLPLATPPDEPALIVAGSIVEINDGVESWKGICTGVTIEAQGGDNRTVNQRITVERYYEPV